MKGILFTCDGRISNVLECATLRKQHEIKLLLGFRNNRCYPHNEQLMELRNLVNNEGFFCLRSVYLEIRMRIKE
ncbi:CLUMA_CG017493, isoform A [Clunio marinus]|uniref:CLUMA_CG017493, isoform A n=1 Tax=Clunio marinus TaxID=568069 RepID=A0A1J1IW59_9DIPT|nr:CLUMA_CG017493, isoform A [Clunio marinus]